MKLLSVSMHCRPTGKTAVVQMVPITASILFSRLQYNYDEKYLLTALIRRDGSSRFGANNKFGYFPSVSVGWIPTLESFFPKKMCLPA
jgi:hypothetical protein